MLRLITGTYQTCEIQNRYKTGRCHALLKYGLRVINLGAINNMDNFMRHILFLEAYNIQECRCTESFLVVGSSTLAIRNRHLLSTA